MKRTGFTATVLAKNRNEDTPKHAETFAFILLYTPGGEQVAIKAKLDDTTYRKLCYSK